MRRVASDSANAGSFITAMPWPMRSAPSNLDGFANGFRAADFSSVADDVQAFVARQIESGAEIGAWAGKVRRRPSRRRRRRSYGASRRERATSFAASAPNWRTASKIQAVRRRLNGGDLRSLADGREIRFDILHAAQHHADRNGNFRVDDVLAQKLFEQPSRDQRVVLRIAQKRSDPFENVDEAREIGISVARSNFFDGERGRRGARQAQRPFAAGSNLRDGDGVRLWAGRQRWSRDAVRWSSRRLYCEGNGGRPALIQAVIQ